MDHKGVFQGRGGDGKGKLCEEKERGDGIRIGFLGDKHGTEVERERGNEMERRL